jgi:DNA-binding LytR/AlgR family response regulator
MILKIGICDDESSVITQITNYLELYSFQNDVDFETSTFTNSISLLQNYTKPGAFHVLFLDVEMPEMNGIELANAIRQLPDRNVQIIFVSSYPEYMKDSFHVRAFQYLTKPLDQKVFDKEMHRIIAEIKEQSLTKFIIKTNEADFVVDINEILYLKTVDSKAKKIDFVLFGQIVHSQGTIHEYETQLNSLGFIVPSRGYLIQLQHLRYIRKNELILCNNDIIPLSRRKEKLIRNYFNEKLLHLAKHR